MIQRSQTLWLLVSAILAFLTLKISFFSGNLLVENVKQFQKFTAMSNMLLMILTVIAAVGSLVTVFLYKNRNTQWKICLSLFGVAVINLVLYFVASGNFVPGEWSYDLTAIAAIAIPVFLLLAARGIYKDEKLVKSVDRLR